MIDIKLLRSNKKIFYDSCKARGFDLKYLDEFFVLDDRWRSNLKKINEIKHDKNTITMEISKNIKKGNDVEQLKNNVVQLNKKIEELSTDQNEIETERDKIIRLIPNLLYRDVPVCKGDENNKLVRYSGTARVFREDMGYFRENSGNSENYEILENRPLSHVDLMNDLDLVDLDRASKIAGSRFYFIKNRLFKLELALTTYAVDFLSQRNFSIVEPPFMINYASMAGATDIETFKDTLYKIEGDDLYLIATAEHPIASMLSGEIMNEDELPLRIGGVSSCFRKEAGAHGKDTKGIFRVHQFNKIEQFIFCKPDLSWDYFDELVKNSEDIYKSLEIPYRVVNVCSGELGNLAAKKYDSEAWYPSQGKFREIVSASNDTDYQARSLNIKYRAGSKNEFVHTLNSTAIATTRILVAIMENYQREGYIEIPKVLIPYTGFDRIEKEGNNGT